MRFGTKIIYKKKKRSDANEMRETPCVPVIYTPGRSAQMARGRGKRSAPRLGTTTETRRGDPLNRCAKQ